MNDIKWDKEHKLEHPSNGTLVFGYLPELKVVRGPTFSSGPIYLKYGVHYGPGRGFGFVHLWKAHFKHLENHDDALVEVRRHVAEHLGGPVVLFHERESRVQAVRFRVGSLILEAYQRPEPHFSVVSGGYMQEGKGTRVARIDPSRVSTLPTNEKAP